MGKFENTKKEMTGELKKIREGKLIVNHFSSPEALGGGVYGSFVKVALKFE